MGRRISRRSVIKALLGSAFVTACRRLNTPSPTFTAVPPTATTTHTPAPLPSLIPASTLTATPIPHQPVISPSRLIQISAGGAHSLALREDGKVWGWGSVLGPDSDLILTPIVLPMLEDIVSIHTENNWFASVFVDNSGRIFRMGYPDEAPELTQIPSPDGVIMARIQRDTIVALCEDGTVWAYGEPGVGVSGILGIIGTEEVGQFMQLPLNGIVDFSITHHKAAFLDEDNAVWVWGLNEYDTFGMGAGLIDPPERHPIVGDAVGVAFGSWFSVLRSDGSIWEYRNHAIDNPRELFRTAVQIDGNEAGGYNLALLEGGLLWGWGFNGSGKLGLDRTHEYIHFPFEISGYLQISSVSAGLAHILALSSTGTVWAWGSNRVGELGIGSVSDDYVFSPTTVLISG
jgi:alpha-tubulin suppressor-like RCC1 family protein